MFKALIIWSTQTILILKGNIQCICGTCQCYININYSFYSRIGWLTLVLIFATFTFSICVDQVTRFLSNPVIFTVDTNFYNWSYNWPDVTICTNFANESFIEKSYQHNLNTQKNFKNISFEDHQRYMKIIASLNAENIQQFQQFEEGTWFRNLSGEDLFGVAVNVRTFLKFYLESI